MSAANATRIFGIRVSIDPKILIGGLVAVAGLLYWYNSRSEDGAITSTVRTPAVPTASGSGAGSSERKAIPRRTGSAMNERGILRMRPVDPTKGDVDPTLHLDLLERLRAVQEGKIGRSVFEIGALAQNAEGPAIKGPKIPVAPIAQVPTTPPPPVIPEVNVPFKYYGYAKPEEKSEANRGLFLDDSENVIVASEGQTVKGHFMIVELTPRSARVEDTTVRRGKTLPVLPMAQQQ